MAVFGSPRVEKDHFLYRLVFNPAKLIGSAGMDLVTGGPGLMDAASSGYNAGRRGNTTHSIGLNIRLPLEQTETAHPGRAVLTPGKWDFSFRPPPS